MPKNSKLNLPGHEEPELSTTGAEGNPNSLDFIPLEPGDFWQQTAQIISENSVPTRICSPFSNNEKPVAGCMKKERRNRCRVSVACVPCNRAKTSCGGERPCKRCVSKQIEHECKNVKHKKKGRPRKNKKNFSTKKEMEKEFNLTNNNSTNFQLHLNSSHMVHPKRNQINECSLRERLRNDNSQTERGRAVINKERFSLNFRNKMRLNWYQIWQPEIVRTFIHNNVVSPSIHFSVSLIRQALTEKEFEYFRSQLNRLFIEMGFSAPATFHHFTFTFKVDNSPELATLNTLPVYTMRYRFVESRIADLDVFLYLSSSVKKILLYDEEQIASSLNSGNSAKHSLPFFWRCFSPKSWDKLLQIEQLACGCITPTEGFRLQLSLLARDGFETVCSALIRYSLNSLNFFDTVEYYLVPFNFSGEIDASIFQRADQAYRENLLISEENLLSAFDIGNDNDLEHIMDFK